MLFEAETLQWSKVANTELEEDATQWPRQVLTELFRVLPEIADYTPDVKFLRVNEEQGYALGVIVVTNGTNTALSTQPLPGAQPPKALIPLVVKGGALCPLDTVMSSNGRMYPLTVERLREVLYRPEGFDLLGEDGTDANVWQLFAPPGRNDFGTGGMQGMMGANGMQHMQGNGMKMAMLEALDGTILQPDVDALAARLNADEKLLKAATENPAMIVAFDKLAHANVVSERTALAYQGTLREMYPAQVVQMRFDDGTGMYDVKTANRDHGVVQGYQLDRREFLAFAGTKLAAAVDTEGGATVAGDSPRAVVVADSVASPSAEVITAPGVYLSASAEAGTPALGYAVPNLLDGEGNTVPLTLFVTAEGAVVQAQVAGAAAAGELALPRHPPKGRGCFYVLGLKGPGGGKVQATVPFKVVAAMGQGDVQRYECVDLTGERVTVVMMPGADKIVALPHENQLILPGGAGFVSLDHEVPALLERPGGAGKTASAQMAGRIVVRGGEDAYVLDYHRLPKLAAAFPERGLSYDDVHFVLCTAGLGARKAYESLNKVASGSRLTVFAEDLGSLPTVDRSAIDGYVKSTRELRTDLLKEATALPDVMSVDAVLSLDFINSENVRTFISMIPYLEKSLNKICELTFAARLGLSEIPEAAAARAARGLNDVVRGLKALALRESANYPEAMAAIRHPARHYILYLLSKRLYDTKGVLQQLSDAGLSVPTDDLAEGFEELTLGVLRARAEMAVPSPFDPTSPRPSASTLAFLRRWRIHDAWRKTPAFTAAEQLLRQERAVCHALELLLLGPLSPQAIAERLCFRHGLPASLMNPASVKAYAHYFWNPGAMTVPEWRKFIAAYFKESQTEYLAALQAPRSAAGAAFTIAIADRDPQLLSAAQRYEAASSLAFGRLMHHALADGSQASDTYAAFAALNMMRVADEELSKHRGGSSDLLDELQRLQTVYDKAPPASITDATYIGRPALQPPATEDVIDAPTDP